MTRAVVVGSGPNGMAAAVTLAAAGLEVTVFEAAGTIGGGTRTSELTLPGLLHDDCSGFHPLALDTPFSRAFDLAGYGLEWAWPEVQYSHPLDGGGGAAAWRSSTRTESQLASDGPAWASIFGRTAHGLTRLSEDILHPMIKMPHHPIELARFGAISSLPADVLSRRWSTPPARALFAGLAAHSMRPFNTLMSSAIGHTLGAAAHRYGWPVSRGGSGAIARATASLLSDLGGTIETGTTVTALGQLGRYDLLMLDLTPSAAGCLLGEAMPPRVARGLRRFRHGPGVFKVDFAVSEGIPWAHEPSRRAGTVHVGGTYEQIAAAETEIARGRMPERPFVLVGQQYLADPSRRSGGLVPVYAYAHVPAGYPEDATNAIETQIERFAPGFRDRIVARSQRSPAQLQRHNANLVGGDVVGGANSAAQLVFRPRLTGNPYSLGVPGTYLCSASTPPGAGAHGMCGYNAATSALKHLTRREGHIAPVQRQVG